MIRPGTPGAILVLLLGALGVPASADVIHTTDGKEIDDVRIVDESLKTVVYKKGNTEQTVASEEVLSIEYERMPRLLEEAQQSLLEGDVPSALERFDLYVEGQISNPNERRYAWAPAWAAWRALGLRSELADVNGVIEAASRLIRGFPESRYVPAAYLARASAQIQKGDVPAARQTIGELAELVGAKALSKRWELETRLVQIRVDEASPEKKRDQLAAVASAAGGQFPTVRNRALVAEGETYLEQASAIETQDASKARELREQARGVFQGIVDDPKAEDETLAGAYTGLGDCLFYMGIGQKDQEMLRQALMHYLRVPVLYKQESQYVPRALFYAMRCFGLLEDPARARDMKRELKRSYPRSPWASEADKY
jgi:hypothetical protein